MPSPNESIKQLDELLNLPQQMWLVGAGISCNAGIPLMHPLTDRIAKIIDDPFKEYFNVLFDDLNQNSHVEHVLSQIGDLISIAERSREKEVEIGKNKIDVIILRNFHGAIQDCIRKIVKCGYKPPVGGNAEVIGTEGKSIVEIEDHINFINAIFSKRRAGLERRPPIAFFTINYDTLLEDALALCRIHFVDGFTGGSMAFWNPQDIFLDSFCFDGKVQAKLYKLHGSIDWYKSNDDVVVRRREGATYPEYKITNLLIYPQAIKYQITQQNPFATLFNSFRTALNHKSPGILAICGYSFGDEHINMEIENAMRQLTNQVTITAFVKQNENRLSEPDQGLPDVLLRWLSNSSESWRERILVAGSHGIYHGSLNNLYPPEVGQEFDWWSFQGLIKLLINGPEALL